MENSHKIRSGNFVIFKGPKKYTSYNENKAMNYE